MLIVISLSRRKTPQKILLAHIKAKPKQVFCGPDTSAVLFENGDMYVCGSNDYNKLGFEKTSRIMALVCIRRENNEVVDSDRVCGIS